MKAMILSSATQPAFFNIRYADGSEELYDMENDPQEWKNLAGDPQHAAIIAEHRQWLPKVDSPPAPGSQHRILTYDPATREAVWEGKKIEPEKRTRNKAMTWRTTAAGSGR